MLSITPADYARVVATVFVDSKTNEVHGPFLTRDATFTWLRGDEFEPGNTALIADTDQKKTTPLPNATPSDICTDIEHLWTSHCSERGTLGQ